MRLTEQDWEERKSKPLMPPTQLLSIILQTKYNSLPETAPSDPVLANVLNASRLSQKLVDLIAHI